MRSFTWIAVALLLVSCGRDGEHEHFPEQADGGIRDSGGDADSIDAEVLDIGNDASNRDPRVPDLPERGIAQVRSASTQNIFDFRRDDGVFHAVVGFRSNLAVVTADSLDPPAPLYWQGIAGDPLSAAFETDSLAYVVTRHGTEEPYLIIWRLNRADDIWQLSGTSVLEECRSSPGDNISHSLVVDGNSVAVHCDSDQNYIVSFQSDGASELLQAGGQNTIPVELEVGETSLRLTSHRYGGLTVYERDQFGIETWTDIDIEVPTPEYGNVSTTPNEYVQTMPTNWLSIVPKNGGPVRSYDLNQWVPQDADVEATAELYGALKTGDEFIVLWGTLDQLQYVSKLREQDGALTETIAANPNPIVFRDFRMGYEWARIVNGSLYLWGDNNGLSDQPAIREFDPTTLEPR